MSERVVLAYSGGLDTSVAIPYLAEQTGAEVIAVAVDVGQGGEDLNVIRQRALACGAVEAEVDGLPPVFERDEGRERLRLVAGRGRGLREVFEVVKRDDGLRRLRRREAQFERKIAGAGGGGGHAR